MRDRALILRRFAFGETSLVVQVITREHGRVHLMAKGAYREKSRLYGVLDFFDTLEISWSTPRRGDLATLREATLSVRRHVLARKLRAYRAALAVLELTGLGTREGQSEPELYDALEHSLDELARGEHPPELDLVEFELGFLHNLGLAPALIACAACGGEAHALPPEGQSPPRAAFSSGAGGRLCLRCAEEARSHGRRVGTLPEPVLDRAHAILEHVRSSPSNPRPELPAMEPAEIVRVSDAVARFLEYHLESRPKSFRTFLASPHRNRP